MSSKGHTHCRRNWNSPSAREVGIATTPRKLPPIPERGLSNTDFRRVAGIEQGNSETIDSIIAKKTSVTRYSRATEKNEAPKTNPSELCKNDLESRDDDHFESKTPLQKNQSFTKRGGEAWQKTHFTTSPHKGKSIKTQLKIRHSNSSLSARGSKSVFVDAERPIIEKPMDEVVVPAALEYSAVVSNDDIFHVSTMAGKEGGTTRDARIFKNCSRFLRVDGGASIASVDNHSCSSDFRPQNITSSISLPSSFPRSSKRISVEDHTLSVKNAKSSKGPGATSSILPRQKANSVEISPFTLDANNLLVRYSNLECVSNFCPGEEVSTRRGSASDDSSIGSSVASSRNSVVVVNAKDFLEVTSELKKTTLSVGTSVSVSSSASKNGHISANGTCLDSTNGAEDRDHITAGIVSISSNSKSSLAPSWKQVIDVMESVDASSTFKSSRAKTLENDSMLQQKAYHIIGNDSVDSSRLMKDKINDEALTNEFGMLSPERGSISQEESDENSIISTTSRMSSASSVGTRAKSAGSLSYISQRQQLESGKRIGFLTFPNDETKQVSTVAHAVDISLSGSSIKSSELKTDNGTGDPSQCTDKCAFITGIPGETTESSLQQYEIESSNTAAARNDYGSISQTSYHVLSHDNSSTSQIHDKTQGSKRNNDANESTTSQNTSSKSHEVKMDFPEGELSTPKTNTGSNERHPHSELSKEVLVEGLQEMGGENSIPFESPEILSIPTDEIVDSCREATETSFGIQSFTGEDTVEEPFRSRDARDQYQLGRLQARLNKRRNLNSGHEEDECTALNCNSRTSRIKNVRTLLLAPPASDLEGSLVLEPGDIIPNETLSKPECTVTRELAVNPDKIDASHGHHASTLTFARKKPPVIPSSLNASKISHPLHDVSRKSVPATFFECEASGELASTTTSATAKIITDNVDNVSKSAYSASGSATTSELSEYRVKLFAKMLHLLEDLSPAAHWNSSISQGRHSKSGSIAERNLIQKLTEEEMSRIMLEFKHGNGEKETIGGCVSQIMYPEPITSKLSDITVHTSQDTLFSHIALADASNDIDIATNRHAPSSDLPCPPSPSTFSKKSRTTTATIQSTTEDVHLYNDERELKNIERKEAFSAGSVQTIGRGDSVSSKSPLPDSLLKRSNEGTLQKEKEVTKITEKQISSKSASLEDTQIPDISMKSSCDVPLENVRNEINERLVEDKIIPDTRRCNMNGSQDVAALDIPNESYVRKTENNALLIAKNMLGNFEMESRRDQTSASSRASDAGMKSEQVFSTDSGQNKIDMIPMTNKLRTSTGHPTKQESKENGSKSVSKGVKKLNRELRKRTQDIAKQRLLAASREAALLDFKQERLEEASKIALDEKLFHEGVLRAVTSAEEMQLVVDEVVNEATSMLSYYESLEAEKEPSVHDFSPHFQLEKRLESKTILSFYRTKSVDGGVEAVFKEI